MNHKWEPVEFGLEKCRKCGAFRSSTAISTFTLRKRGSGTVKKHFEHDLLHELVAHKHQPMFKFMQKDGTVECHRDLWDNLSFDDKVSAVLEEAYVIGLERHIVPTIMDKQNGYPPFQAFKWALFRICTTLTSGFFRRFAIENYFTILNRFNKSRMLYPLGQLKVEYSL